MPKEQTTFNKKTMTKTPGGHGFGMKRNYKEREFDSSGLHLIEVFRWQVPKELKEEYKRFLEYKNA